MDRKWTTKRPGEYQVYGTTPEDMVPEMTKAGEGHRIHVTGLTHNEKGYPDMTVPNQEKMLGRLIGKITQNADKLVDIREDQTEGADVVVVSYGITSRVAMAAIEQARAKGVKVGGARLVIAWPFPAKRMQELAKTAKVFVVPEMNMGQMVQEVERAVAGAAKVVSVPHAGGSVHDVETILSAIMEASR